MYGGVRGRKTKVGRKLLRFPPTRLYWMCALRTQFEALEASAGEFLVGALDELADGHLALHDVLLFDQGVLLEELVQTAVGNLLNLLFAEGGGLLGTFFLFDFLGQCDRLMSCC